MRTFQAERDGEAIEREASVAKKIGHDLARTNYEVDRTHRSSASTDHEAPITQQDAAQGRVHIAPASSCSGCEQGDDSALKQVVAW